MWDDEKIERVRYFATLKYTARQIAQEFGVTRNSIIGLSRRKGIRLWIRDRGNPHSNFNGKPRPKKLKNGVKQPPTPPTLPPLPVPVVCKRYRAALLPEGNKACNIHELKTGICRWPLWGEGYTPFSQQLYCGRDISEPSSYCEEHRQLGKSKYWYPRP